MKMVTDELGDVDVLINNAGARTHAPICFTHTCTHSPRLVRTRARAGTRTYTHTHAGIVSGKPLLETPDGKIQAVFNVNVLAHFWTVRVCVCVRARMVLFSAR
jgi:NAD(P)-dependent dehydrogenase (short-subunit alcohol dehydrogenase family)